MVSQWDHIIFTINDENQCCLTEWNSSKIEHVVRSTVVSETASVTGRDKAFFISQLLKDNYHLKKV